MRDVFGLPDPYSVDEPGPHPARVHQGVHRGRGRRGPRRPDPRRRTPTFARPRPAAHRGHGPRRRRRGHRAVERGRRGDARRAGDHRAARAASGGRSTRSCSTPRFSRAHGVAVAGAIVNKVDVDEQPGIEETLERGLARHGIPLLGVLPYRPILSNPTLGDGPRGRRTASRSARARTSTGSSRASPSARWSRTTCSSAIGPGTLVIVPGRPRGRDPDAYRRAPRDEPAGDGGRGAARRDAGRVDAGPEGAAIGMVLTGGYEPRPEVLDGDPRGGHLRGARRRGHVHRRVRGPRPAGQDPRRGHGEDRADQGARRGAPRHGPLPRSRDARRASTEGLADRVRSAPVQHPVRQPVKHGARRDSERVGRHDVRHVRRPKADRRTAKQPASTAFALVAASPRGRARVL